MLINVCYKRILYQIIVFLSFFLFYSLWQWGILASYVYAIEVSGIIYEDVNKNKIFDKCDNGLNKIGVSNGYDIVLTDKKGRYSIDLDNSSDGVFVIKPAKYDFYADNITKIPQFYYAFDSNNTKDYQLNNVNFPLVKSDVKKNFSAVFLGDIQVRNEKDLGYFRDAFIPELIKENADIYITLGDNVYNNMSLYPSLLEVMGKLKGNIYYTAGNHDLTTLSSDSKFQYVNYKKYIGPTYYAFNYGNVHFVVLESVKWDGYNYYGELGERQLHWLKRDLLFVPKDHLIFLIMHIPLISWDGKSRYKELVKDKDRLFSIIKDYKNLHIVAGHTHTIEKIYPEDYKIYNGKLIDFSIFMAGATCGKKWKGPLDEFGVPLSYMKDGSPKGFYIYKFKKNSFKEQYKVSGRSKHYQMHIYIVDNNTLVNNSTINKEQIARAKVYVNIFNGDRFSKVLFSINDSLYLPMNREFVYDPLVKDVLGYNLRYKSHHIWTGQIPDLDKGIYVINVKFVDRYGKTYKSSKLFKIQ